MSKLPYMQFYPADYLIDTAVLSLAAQGAWMRILCALHSSETRGTKTWTLAIWARYIGVTEEIARDLIAEIRETGVGNVEEANGDVTLENRRMFSESITKEQTRRRVARHRLKQQGAGQDTNGNGGGNGAGNAEITPKKLEARSQKSEKETTSPCPTSPPASPDGVGALPDQSTSTKPTPPPPNPEGEIFLTWFLALLAETEAPTPKLTPSIREAWAQCYDRMIRLDGRTKDDVKEVCRWARNDAFWRRNFLSPMKLRDKHEGVMWFDHFLSRSRAGSTSSGRPGSGYVLPADSPFRIVDHTKLAAAQAAAGESPTPATNEPTPPDDDREPDAEGETTDEP